MNTRLCLGLFLVATSSALLATGSGCGSSSNNNNNNGGGTGDDDASIKDSGGKGDDDVTVKNPGDDDAELPHGDDASMNDSGGMMMPTLDAGPAMTINCGGDTGDAGGDGAATDASDDATPSDAGGSDAGGNCPSGYTGNVQCPASGKLVPLPNSMSAPFAVNAADAGPGQYTVCGVVGPDEFFDFTLNGSSYNWSVQSFGMNSPPLPTVLFKGPMDPAYTTSGNAKCIIGMPCGFKVSGDDAGSINYAVTIQINK